MDEVVKLALCANGAELGRHHNGSGCVTGGEGQRSLVTVRRYSANVQAGVGVVVGQGCGCRGIDGDIGFDITIRVDPL